VVDSVRLLDDCDHRGAGRRVQTATDSTELFSNAVVTGDASRGVVLAPVVLNLHDPVVQAGHRVENRTIGTPAAFVPTRTGASGVTVHPFRVAASAGVETRTSGRTTAAAAAPAMPNLRILARVLVDIGVLLR